MALEERGSRCVIERTKTLKYDNTNLCLCGFQKKVKISLMLFIIFRSR